MQDVINSTVKELVRIIDSKSDNRKVAWQFVLEELDAARKGTPYVQDRIKSFYINKKEYQGAMGRSWADVDGAGGPQQFLILLTKVLSEQFDMDMAAMVKISIVEYIIHHYKFGRFHIDNLICHAKKPLKLFELTTSEDKLNSNFKYLQSDENKPIRDVLSRWASGFEDRDNKFNHEFQTTFNSSFWEIYLHQCFKDLNMRVDFSRASPDFTVETKLSNTINIEAVTANHSSESEPEWGDVISSGNIKKNADFLNFSCVRILNAIDSKHKKFFKTYSKYDHVKDNPYVIAIAPFEQPMFFMQNNEAIIRVLYGQGIDKDNDFKEVFVPEAIKGTGVALNLGIFTNEKFKEISAVIFSTTATIGKAITQSTLPRNVRTSRYHKSIGLIPELKSNDKHFETHLDGLQIHHNPFAEHKLDYNEFDSYEITHYFYDTKAQKIDNQQKSYTIISRNIFPAD